MSVNENLNELEETLLRSLREIRQTIATEQREVIAVVNGLTSMMSAESRQQCLEDSTTCLMMSTEYPMIIDPAHVDDAVLRRSCRFLASLITQMLSDYNKYAVPLKIELLFDANYFGRLTIKWAHHVELLPEGQTP